MANLKPFLDSTKISLEKRASDQFGAAVEDFGRGKLSRAVGLPAPLANEQVPFDRKDGSFYASSYAHALAGATSYRPKLNFLFKVEFIFTPQAIAAFPNVFGGVHQNDFTFMVRSVDRPKIDFEYDEVNMYNFNTKVLKKIRHRELTVTFIDDTGNRVLNFFRHLLMIQSPITRRQLLREGTMAPPQPGTLTSSNGMQFSTDFSNPTNYDNAIRGTVDREIKDPSQQHSEVIQVIRVKQMYVDPGAQLGASTKEVIYDFINARIVSFDLDVLTHDTSDVSLMTMQFDYDWMEIVDVGNMKKVDGPNYNIAVPGVGGAPIDISVYGKNPLTNPGNGYLNIINNQLGRAAQTITSSAISRAVTSIAGNGRFASAIGAPISSMLGGIIGAGARNLGIGSGIPNVATGLMKTINQGNARAATTSVIDSAEGGPANVLGIAKSTDGGLI